MEMEDSYIVRIFSRVRREGTARCVHDIIAITGIVEDPATGERRSFHDIEELWEMLADPPGPDDRGEPKRRRNNP